MATGPRVVAELGRPETADEAAARKAESSRVYRSSQTFRNLIAALVVTLAVVAVIVFAVPRGTPADQPAIDVPALAADASAAYGRTIVVPQVPAEWRVNGASVQGDADPAWTVVYVPDASGYLRVAQGFDVGVDWDARVLKGAAADGTVTIDGIPWLRYEVADPAASGNVSYALGTGAGSDRVLIYGSTDAATAAVAASGLSEQIRTMDQEAR